MYWPWAKEHYLFIGLTRDVSMLSIAFIFQKNFLQVDHMENMGDDYPKPFLGDSNWFLHCLNLHGTKAGRENDTFKLEKQSKQLLKIDILNVQGQSLQSHRSLIFISDPK